MLEVGSEGAEDFNVEGGEDKKYTETEYENLGDRLRGACAGFASDYSYSSAVSAFSSDKSGFWHFLIICLERFLLIIMIIILGWVLSYLSLDARVTLLSFSYVPNWRNIPSFFPMPLSRVHQSVRCSSQCCSISLFSGLSSLGP